MSTLWIGGHPVGSRHPVFVIAEAGVNHNGDEALARDLIDVAAAAGADAVKFQNFKSRKLATPGTQKAKYQVDTTGGGDQLEMLERLELSAGATRRLAAHCRRKGILFMSTPYDDESAALLGRMKVPAIKIASTDTTNYGFLRRVAAMGIPLILSTGMTELLEVAGAVDAVRGAGNDDIVVLHCTSSYPAPEDEANLRAMTAMATAFDVIPGYSDHTPGVGIGPYAVAFGACVIEKHFTLDKKMEGPDHQASLDPKELRTYLREVRRVERLRGDGVKRVTAAERDNRRVMQKSVVLIAAKKKGQRLSASDLAAMRPGTGISAAELGAIVGRRLARDVAPLEPLQWDWLAE